MTQTLEEISSIVPVSPPSQAAAAPRRPYLEIVPRSGWIALALPEIWRYRDLLLVLAARDVKLRYRQTALGVLWVILQPLMVAGIFTFVFGTVLHAPSDGIPYFAFSFAGMLAYNAFSSTLTKAGSCVVLNNQLVSKVFFPRLILPLSTVPSSLLDFAVGMGLMAVLMALYRVAPGWPFLLLPLWLAMLLGLAVGLGMYASAVMVQYRDLQYVIPVFVQMILYASPVAIPLSAAPANLRFWFYINPLSGLLEAFRWSLLGRGELHWYAVIYSSACVLFSVLFGAFAFKRMERQFADVI